MSGYIPPHKRGRQNNNKADSRFARVDDEPRGRDDRGDRGGYNNNRGFQNNNNRDNNFNDDRRRNDNFGRRGNTGDIRSNNGNSGDIRSRPRNKRFGRGFSQQAQRDLSTVADPAYEKELFGGTHQATVGINFNEYDKIPVDVSGRDIIAPVDSFSELLGSAPLLRNIELCNFANPTPIQKYSIPTVLANRDLMACAQTGSGKTAAFLIPVIEMLYGQPRDDRGSYSMFHPRALILAPTRELAQQIHIQAKKLTYCCGMRSVCVYGGADIREQFNELKSGVDILVATPGRLWDMIERRKMSLADVNFLIMDEADRMLDMGFEPQIRQIVQNTDLNLDRRTLMYSATFPDEIQGMAQDFLDNYIFLAVGRVGSTTALITQRLKYVQEQNKMSELLDIVPKMEGKILVFCGTKRMADGVTYKLRDCNYNAVAIHGDKNQSEREHALQMFRDDACDVMVATDVAARGLDIPNVMWVLQFDLPQNIDDYVHRIGRTGRRGNTGTAIAFTNENNRSIFNQLLQILREAKQDIPTWFTQLIQTTASRGGRYDRGRKYGGERRQGNPKNERARDVRAPVRQKVQEKKKKKRRATGGLSNTAW